MDHRFPALNEIEGEVDEVAYRAQQLKLLKKRRKQLRLHFNSFNLNEKSFQEAYRLVVNTLYIK